MAHATINGLNMYYEIHGEGGTPLVMIHGSLMSSTAFAQIIPQLSKKHQVIVADMQAHGRTADIDRALDCKQMADDVAALAAHLGHEKVDVFGFSMGGGIALQTAIRHPKLVRKAIIASSGYIKEGWHPEAISSVEYLTPEMLAGSPFEQEYQSIAPQPENWPQLINKIKALDIDSSQASPEQVKNLAMPVLLIAGDSDIIRADHMAKFFELLGGIVPGDMAGMPKSQLAILPGTSHIGLLSRPEIPVFIENFVDAPIADDNK